MRRKTKNSIQKTVFRQTTTYGEESRQKYENPWKPQI